MSHNNLTVNQLSFMSSAFKLGILPEMHQKGVGRGHATQFLYGAYWEATAYSLHTTTMRGS